MKVSTRTATIAAGISFVLVVAGCSSSGGGDSGKSGGSNTPTGQAVFGEGTDFPENLMPLISAGNATSTANLEVRVLLSPFDVNPDYTVTFNKDLLASEPTSETTDGKQVVTYKINPKAVWSDGTAISAKDFAYTWNTSKSSDPAKGGCAALLSTSGYDQIASVEGADNDKTVTVTYSVVFADWKSVFSPILPAHLMDKGDPKANCDLITKGWPIGDGITGDISSGPWQIKKSNIDAEKKVVVLVPNEKWYGEKPKLAKLIYNNIGNDSDTNVKAIQGSEVNVIYPQPQTDIAKQLEGLAPDITTKITFGLSFEHMDFNTKNKHLAKLEVRQAIAKALDRKDIVSKTVGQFDDRAQVLNNRVYVNNQPEYADNSGGEYDASDIPAAAALLEKAGYTKGADGIYTSATDGPLALEMMTTQNNPLRESTIDLVTAQLAKAGIKITKFLNEDIFAGKEKPKSLEAGGFDIALFAWVSSPFVSSTPSLYQCPTADGVAQNYSRGCDKEADATFVKMKSTDKPEEVKTFANDADKLLWGDMFTLPLFQKPTLLAYTSTYKNIQDNATTFGPTWNSDKWTLS